MLVLYETAMGYALFKLTDSAKLTDPNLYQEFETPERANGLCVQIFSRLESYTHLQAMCILPLLMQAQTEIFTPIYVDRDCR
jgi:hypothetical protein